MNRLGEEKIIHIVASTAPVLNRPFISQVKRCEEGLFKLQNLENLLRDRNVYLPRNEFDPKGYVELYQLWRELYEKSGAHPANVLNDLITEIDNAWSYYQDLTKRGEVLATKMQYFRDNLAIIRAGEMKFGRSFFTHR